jgi:hypothetical protein
MMDNVEPPYRFASDRVLGDSPEFREEYERVTIELDNGADASMWKRTDETAQAT